MVKRSQNENKRSTYPVRRNLVTGFLLKVPVLLTFDLEKENTPLKKVITNVPKTKVKKMLKYS